jgi:hypothetical protein
MGLQYLYAYEIKENPCLNTSKFYYVIDVENEMKRKDEEIDGLKKRIEELRKGKTNASQNTSDGV